MFFLLIKLFPYTGLGRITALPVIFILNSIIILFGLLLSQRVAKGARFKRWSITLILTILTTIAFYPQEFNPHIGIQSTNAVMAIKDYDQITIEELNVKGNVNNPRYVVALYKFKDQIPLDGTYKVYQRESSYFYNSEIRSIDEIGAKLIGYHKVMWWYLKIFK